MPLRALEIPTAHQLRNAAAVIGVTPGYIELRAKQAHTSCAGAAHDIAAEVCRHASLRGGPDG